MMSTKKGFSTIDAVVASSILATIFVIIVSLSSIGYKSIQANEHCFSAMIIMENHLMELVSVETWDDLNETTETLSDGISVSYSLIERTKYDTQQLRVNFDTHTQEYEFLLERSIHGG